MEISISGEVVKPVIHIHTIAVIHALKQDIPMFMPQIATLTLLESVKNLFKKHSLNQYSMDLKFIYQYSTNL